MKHAHRFVEPRPEIDWAHLRKPCGHSPWERCNCTDELWTDYARWIEAREHEGEMA